jgi:hypothetical protein
VLEAEADGVRSVGAAVVCSPLSIFNRERPIRMNSNSTPEADSIRAGFRGSLFRTPNSPIDVRSNPFATLEADPKIRRPLRELCRERELDRVTPQTRIPDCSNDRP